MNKAHIYGIAWFIGRGPKHSFEDTDVIGIVVAWTKEGENRAFIGVASKSTEINDAGNAELIVAQGAPFPLSEAKSVIRDFGKEVHYPLV